MNIYIDEAGTFPITDRHNSWCVVSAYVSPERDRRHLEELVRELRKGSLQGRLEVKRNDLSESEYFDFLSKLGRLNGVAFAVATDMRINTQSVMLRHRDDQALRILDPIPMMQHQSMRDALAQLSSELGTLPVNLYAQLKFQTVLFHTVVSQATLYYVQRFPQTLGAFRWRVDRKDVVLTGYERTFQRLLPALLQTISLREPIIMLKGADYSRMADFEWPEGEHPDYLQKVYGLPPADGLNLGKMVSNFLFVDSKAVLGVQVADLLASGFRRYLKGEFLDNNRAAALLGALTVGSAPPSLPVRLLTLGASANIEMDAERRVRELIRHSRSMLVAQW
jgi:hypothetical protein